MAPPLPLLRFVLLLLACLAAAAAAADVAERQLSCLLCPGGCLSTIFVSATRPCTATITTTRAASTVTRTNVSTVTQLATSTRTSTVTRVSTTTATATTTNTRVVSSVVTSTRLVPTTTTTTLTSTVSVTGPRTLTSTLTITTTVRTCSANTTTNTNTSIATPTASCTTETINFESATPLPSNVLLASGLRFRNFVVYAGADIPQPPSPPKAGAILTWQDNAFSSTAPFALESLQVFCPPRFCNITLRASRTDAAGARRPAGAGWLTYGPDNDPASFALADVRGRGLGGFEGSFVGIDYVEITAEFEEGLRVALFDDIIISRNCPA